MWRTVARDVELGGVALRKGEMVFLRFGSGDRDEATFADPNRFDILARQRQGSPGLRRRHSYLPGSPALAQGDVPRLPDPAGAVEDYSPGQRRDRFSLQSPIPCCGACWRCPSPSTRAEAMTGV